MADDSGWDLGQGAGFYLNATQAPWSAHYRMYDYVTEELPSIVHAQFSTTGRQRITGHSMGGHGALVVGLRNPDRYATVSAFAPIVAPCDVPWGHKAFGAYLGADEHTWSDWDATRLLSKNVHARTILIDQGTADGFLAEQLQPHRFVAAAEAVGQAVTLRLQPDYDHGYYFIATFAGDHVDHAAAGLFAPS